MIYFLVSSFKETDKKLPILETVCYKAVGDGEFGSYQAEIAMEAQNRLEDRMKRDEIWNWTRYFTIFGQATFVDQWVIFAKN